MDTIKNVLQEELEYAIKLKKRYEEDLEKLPKGSLWKNKAGDKIYYSLAYREGKKVKFDYLGRLSAGEIKKYKENIDKRERYKKLLKDLKQEIRYLQKVLHVKTS